MAVAVNLSPVPRTVPTSAPVDHILLASDEGAKIAGDGVSLPPESVAIVAL